LNIAAGRDWYLKATQYAKIAEGSAEEVFDSDAVRRVFLRGRRDA